MLERLRSARGELNHNRITEENTARLARLKLST
jgi:hypothetical protein